jgi:hypothetical protein
MSLSIATERRLLTATEFEAVAPSRFPQLCGLDRSALLGLARSLRTARDKARDLGRERRRAQRGKAEPRGAGPAPDEAGLTVKKQIFAAALQRVNRELARRDSTARRETQGQNARRALAMKQENRVRHHPSAGRTARHGMRPLDSGAVTTTVDPRKVGSVSQQNRTFQGARDS